MVSPRWMAQPGTTPQYLTDRSSFTFSPREARAPLDDIERAMIQQQERSTRKVQQMRRQTELQVAEVDYWQEKEKRREQRRRQLAMEQEAEHQSRAERAAEIERRRQERLEAAQRHEQEVREAARSGIQAKGAKAEQFELQRQALQEESAEEAAANAARRRAAAEREKALLLERRQVAEHREKVLHAALHRRQQELSADAEFRRAEEAEREMRRQEIRARAEVDTSARVNHLRERLLEKERTLQHRRQEQEQIRELKAEEARQRADSVALQARAAAERDADARAALQARTDDKMRRAEALARHREQLLAEMRRAREQLHQQEQLVRGGLELVRKTGNFELPAEVLQTLQAYAPASPISPRTMLLAPATRRVGSRLRTAGGVSGLMTRSAHGKLTGRGFSASTLRPAAAAGMATAAAATPTRRRRASSDSTIARKSWELGSKEACGVDNKRYSNVVVVPSPDSRREEALRALLSLELVKETERRDIIATVVDERERARLHMIFAAEREIAKKKILALSSSVDVPLQ